MAAQRDRFPRTRGDNHNQLNTDTAANPSSEPWETPGESGEGTNAESNGRFGLA